MMRHQILTNHGNKKKKVILENKKQKNYRKRDFKRTNNKNDAFPFLVIFPNIDKCHLDLSDSCLNGTTNLITTTMNNGRCNNNNNNNTIF